MSYHRRYALSGDTSHGPSWYRAMGSIGSQPPGPRIYQIPRPRARQSLGSLGDDAGGGTTLSTPTISDTDATAQWQANVLAQLQAGVATLQKAELQKWLQIAATVSIPLAAAIWRMIFKSARAGISDSGT